MYKLEVKFCLFPIQVAFVVAIVCFSVFAVISSKVFVKGKINLNHKKEIVAKKSDQIFEIDMLASIQAGDLEFSEGIDGEFAGFEPDIYIMKIARVEEEKKLDPINDFFAKLLAKKGASKEAVAAVVHKTSRSAINSSVFSAPSRRRAPPINLAAFKKAKQEIQDEAIKTVKGKSYDTKELRELISSYYPMFRTCYEKALLHDELLSGNATITLEVNKGSNVSFKGLGKTKSIDELRSCLISTGKDIKFSSDLTGQKIKFSLFFSS